MSTKKKKVIYPEFESGRKGKEKKSKIAKASINKPQYIIIHHIGGTDVNPLADSSNQTFKIVDDYHKKLWSFKSSLGFYIGYHFFIDKAGVSKQGRADTDEGAHTIGKNSQSIGICMAGNFDLTVPTQVQVEALAAICIEKMQKYNIPVENIVPHRKFAAKTCYGYRLPDTWVATVLTQNIKEQLIELNRKSGELLNQL